MSAYQYDMEPADVLVSGDLAVVHCIVRNTWTDTSGTHWQTRSYTEVDRKDEGKWLIWHEHAYSLPGLRHRPSAGDTIGWRVAYPTKRDPSRTDSGRHSHGNAQPRPPNPS